MKGMDGLVPIAFPHNSAVTPTEIMETQAPILVVKKEILPDSAGPGRQRGGPGQVMTFRSIAKGPMTARIRPDKIVCAPPGLDGGMPGRTGEVLLNGEPIIRFPPIEFQPGDELEMRMPGGAGFGPVQQREPERVLRDLEAGFITLRGAQENYGLDLNTDRGVREEHTNNG